jgi:dihydroorotase
MQDILLKKARVIDPARNIDGRYDVAVKNGKIHRIEKDIGPGAGTTVYDFDGKILTPALIDAHCHPAAGLTDHFISPDAAGIDSGVLLVNDGGSAGAANFHTLTELFRTGVRTEMTFFINIATCGLIRGTEIQAVTDVDPKITLEAIGKYGNKIRGVKIRAMESLLGIREDVFGIALKTARDAGLPLMVHVGEFRTRTENDPFDVFSRGVVDRLERGDILSHFMTWRPGGMMTPDGKIYPELKEARKRGVILDSSHGKFNFSFKVAKAMMEEGLFPDIITTDLSLLGFPWVQSLPVTMSKFLNLGMPLPRVVEAVTGAAARALGISGEWGSLEPGRAANITILNMAEGEYEFFDGAAGNKLAGRALLEPVMVFRDGVPHPVRSYYHIPAGAASAVPL